MEKDLNGQSYLQDADNVPLDPWGNAYFYQLSQNGMDFEVGSYGSDGQPGGEGDAADISNKTLANKNSERKNK